MNKRRTNQGFSIINRKIDLQAVSNPQISEQVACILYSRAKRRSLQFLDWQGVDIWQRRI